MIPNPWNLLTLVYLKKGPLQIQTKDIEMWITQMGHTYNSKYEREEEGNLTHPEEKVRKQRLERHDYKLRDSNHSPGTGGARVLSKPVAFLTPWSKPMTLISDF